MIQRRSRSGQAVQISGKTPLAGKGRGTAEGRFDLSEDTRSKGLRELGNAGLITTKRRPVNETDFQAEALYMRNVHFLRMDRLSETAAITPRRRVARVPKRRSPVRDDE
ncbi:hypothetical protein [Streptomyces sp. NPDC056165]|uniref:hypothetical protein n=1 Tax=Streptomyces sp. NPDC056165 TaxID=3345733 RepID=UPI0035DBE525